MGFLFLKSKFNFDNNSHSHKITKSNPGQNLVVSQNKQTEVYQGQKSRQQADNTSFTDFETNKNTPQLRHASYSHTDAIDIRKNMQEQNDFLRDQQAFIREIQKNKENNNNIKMPHPASQYLHYSTKPPMKPFLKPVVDYANVHVAS